MQTDVTEPRINLELLDEVWKSIEVAAINQAVEDDITLERLDELHRIDGWAQADWRSVVEPLGEACGTALCFAGWTAQIEAMNRGDRSGGWLIPDDDLIDASNKITKGVIRSPFDGTFGMFERRNRMIAVPEDNPHHVITGDGPVNTISAEYRAIRVLGLSAMEADRLFSCERTFGEVREIVAEIRAKELMRRARKAKRERLMAKGATDGGEG